jgi:hypothetical protein
MNNNYSTGKTRAENIPIKKKLPSLWKPLLFILTIFSNDEGKVAGVGCIGFLAIVALIVYINNLVIDYLVWFVSGEHLPTWMNLIFGLLLAAFSAVIWLVGFLALAFQHLNLFHVPLVH